MGHKVKTIRCDNGTKFKNMIMNEFCEMKGRKPALSFMRPFGCPVTILNTLDHLDPEREKAQRNEFENLPTDPLMPDLKDTADLQYSGIVSNAYDDEVKGAVAEFNNLELTIVVSPIPTTRIHKDHPKEKIIRDTLSAPLTRRMIKTSQEHAMVYVDNIIFGSTKKSLCTEFEGLMHKKFQMSSLGELIFFLGLLVVQRDDGIFITQDKYVANILKKFDFSLVKTASTPIETNKALLKDEEVEDVDVHLYRSMIGSLMYLIASRPDILFVVYACARFQVTPKVSHLHAMKRIFRYLKVYTSCIEQLWATTKVKNVNGEAHILALVDKKKVIITKESIRRDLSFEDEGGVDFLSNKVIFEQLTLMGSTMAFAIICLATNQNFNISKYIFDNMVKHLGGGVKFLMYPRFVQVFMDNQVEGMDKHNAIYVISSHTNKVFANMKMEGDGFSEVLDLEKAKTTQAVEISSLKRRVKKLERKKQSRTLGLKEQSVKVFEKEVSIGKEVIIAVTTLQISKDELTQAQNLIEIKATTPKAITTAVTIVTTTGTRTKGSDKEVEGNEKAKEVRSKRARSNIEHEYAKRQRLEEENESTELKRCLEIVPDNKDDVTIEATPLSSKSPSLLITRSTKKGGKAISRSSKQMKMVYYLLVDKMYPFTRNILHQMWNDVRLQVDYEVDMAYDLRLIWRQINEGYIPK
uniref:Putative ribonuclease H-like domain-containing protein n=1 Tax=Tanacetum cinerariifolium TaxID=118510 RepID=A0A6L2LCR4_TANCI|nr:putative ribonuclease H-like domain-containing protein [Tanacetum cinerariifolium]